jgi:preprotein translocase subunit SecF
MAKDSLASRLYRGDISWDFIGRRKIWYTASCIVMLIGIISIIVRGLNPSIEFKGGAEFQGPLNGHSISQVQDAVRNAGVNPEVAQTTGSGSDTRFQVQTETLPNATVIKVERALESELGLKEDQLNTTTVGSTWGSEITHKAIEGLIIFLIAVIGYLSIRFEWKMALAAIIALVHDLIITAGIYSLAGLQVSPSTVIALLTILGYSLYDTVVVFDKVRENTQGILGGSRMTFSQAANLAINQTLVRSINTSIIALLPVLGLLVIGVGFLGAGSLDDLSVALLIGLASGAYSSIFIATPLLADFKEREPQYQALAKRVASRRAKEAREAKESGSVAAPEALGPDDLVADGAAPAEVAATASAAADAPKAGARPAGSQPARSNRGGRPGGRGSRSKRRR